MPAPISYEIYSIDKIIHPRSKLNTIEKINHLIRLENSLLEKLELVKTKRFKPQNTGGMVTSGSGARKDLQQMTTLQRALANHNSSVHGNTSLD